jgi:hypothetical protein
VLAKDEPLVFSVYTHEHFILRHYLTNTTELSRSLDPQCFSHQQWRNMMAGRHPNGGASILIRDNQNYLSFDEVQRIFGFRDYNKSEDMDYLCIRLPYEVEVVDVVKQVTSTWNLTKEGVWQLKAALNNEFKRSLIEWAMSTFDYCTSNNRIICRKHVAMLERFLMRYGIDPTEQEKSNMRRVIDRWFATENKNFKAYSCADMQFIDESERTVSFERIEWE